MPRYSDDYDPNNSVAPTGGSGGDYLTSKVSPSQTGGLIGQAAQGLGQDIDKAKNQQFEVSIQQAGLANEHAATMAEQQLAIEGGKIYDEYKSMTGLDAANAKDQAVSKYTALSNQISQNLGSPAARKAYEQLATRRLAFTIQDMNSYASAQRKDAYKNGRLSAISLAKDEASRPEVAGNQSQFSDSLGAVVFSANDLFTNPDYGTFKTIPAKTDPKTGLLRYDTSTTDGQVAQKSYDFYIQKETGDVFSNAAKTLASDNPMKAHDFVERNKDMMSAATYANLSHSLAPAVQNEHVRQIADDTFNQFTAQYQNNPTASPVDALKTLFPGIQVTSTKRSPEENSKLPGASPTSNHLSGNAADFVAPPGVSLADVKDRLTARGFTITEAIDTKDNPQTGEKAHYHIAWEPKAGVNDYVDYTNALGMHAPELIKSARQKAVDAGLDLDAQDKAEARMQTKINQTLSAEAVANRANEDDIVRDLYQGKFPSQEALDKDPRFQLLNSRNSILASNIVTRIMPAMARGMQSGYGKEFYSHLISTLEGNENSTTLSNYVGQEKNSPITNTGYQTLGKFMPQDKPEDHAFNKAFVDYLDTLHGQYTGSKQFPGAFSKTESNDTWDKVLAEVIPRVQAGRASGKTADQMFHPDSKDFIQPGVKPPTLQQLMSVMSSRVMAGLTRELPTDYKSPDDLLKVLKQRGPSFRPEFDKIAIQKGWAQPTPPKVPFNP